MNQEKNHFEKTLKYKQKFEDFDPCPICLEDLQSLKWTELKPCNHILCKNCYEVLKINSLATKCPLCRADLESKFEFNLYWLGELIVTLLITILLGLLFAIVIPTVLYLEVLVFLGFTIFFWFFLLIYFICAAMELVQNFKRLILHENLRIFDEL